MRWGLAVWVLLAACGRVHFDVRPDGAVDPDAPDATEVELRCPPDSVLCDTFDVGAKASWVRDLGVQSIVEAAPAPYLGGAICVQSNLALEAAELEHDFAPISTGTLYLRLFVQFPSGYSTTGELDFLHLQDVPKSTTTHLDSDGVGGNLDLTVEGLPPLFSSTAIGLDRWACVEVAVSVGAAGAATLKVDGALIGSTGTGSTNVNWSRVRVGLDGYSASTPPPARACYDELVISRSPLDCAAAGP